MKYSRVKTLSGFVFLLLIFVIGACKNKKLYPDVSNVQVDYKVVDFYKQLNQLDTLNIKEAVKPMYQMYPDFMKTYAQRIIRVGDTTGIDYVQRLNAFINYPPNKDIIDTAKFIFGDFSVFESELEQGFKHYKYYFPDFKVPDVYLMISGFSNSIAVDSSWVGVSIEKYLGSDCKFYDFLQIQKYLRKGMTKEKMSSDIVRAIAMTNYPMHSSHDDIINHMIYKGKLRYFVHRMFPDLQDSLLFDYSDYEMRWCKDNEENMWSSMVEWKQVFSDDRMLIQKYTGDAPFTAPFGNNSAPRAGEFLGYKIVEAYMDEHEEITLDMLMKEQDGRKILAASNYRP